MCFFRRLGDVVFKVSSCVSHPDSASLGLDFAPDCTLALCLYFKVQNKSEVVGFRCNNLAVAESQSRIATFQQGMELVLAKISEYCRSKNKEKHSLQAQNEKLMSEKADLLAQVAQIEEEAEAVRQQTLTKFCLLLNEKKAKIAKLERMVIQLQKHHTVGQGSDDD